MKKYIIYECKKCGIKSEIHDEVWECKASHLGLTSEEMVEYTKIC